MTQSVVIVTGFVHLDPYDLANRARSLEDYLYHSEKLFDAQAPIVVFTDERRVTSGRFGRFVELVAAEFEPKPSERNRLAAVLSARHTLKQHIDWNAEKDTPPYFCLMRHKIEWLRRATELVEAPHYAWLDFGYRHHPDDDPDDLGRRAPPPGKIRLAELTYVPLAARASREEFYRLQRYSVGGGLIVAAAPEIRWLAGAIAEEWNWALERGYAVTDEMMLGWLRFQHPERFDLYYADHPTLLLNYLRPHGSHALIRAMAERARQDDNYDECDARLMELGRERAIPVPRA